MKIEWMLAMLPVGWRQARSSTFLSVENSCHDNYILGHESVFSLHEGWAIRARSGHELGIRQSLGWVAFWDVSLWSKIDCCIFMIDHRAYI
jgi:hypothetical protein